MATLMNKPMPRQRVKPGSHFSWLTPAATLGFLVALLTSAAFKTQVVPDGVRVEISPLANALGALSPVLLALLPVILLAAALNTKSKSVPFAPLCFLLGATLLWEIGRSFAVSPELASKLLVTLAALASSYYVIGLCSNAVGGDRTRQIILRAFAVFAALLILVNAVILAQGSGINLSNHRFSGSTAHPNFLGVQLAICISALAASALAPRASVFMRTAAGVLCMVGFYELVATGSRTGLLVFTVAILLFIILKQRVVSIGVATLVLLGLTALLFAIATGSDPFSFLTSGSYDRGGTDTRAEAWAELWARIEEQPFLGAGLIEGASENSYLRGWAIYGLIFPVLMVALTISGGLRVFWVRKVQGGLLEGALFYALFVALLMGGVFEAYLTDAFSLPIITFILALAFLDFTKADARRPAARPLQSRNPITMAPNSMTMQR